MRVPKFQLTALSVLLCASSAMASHLNRGPAVASIIFTVIYGIVSVLHIIWLVRLRRRRLDSTPLNIENQSLVNSTLPEGVVSTNISVSEKSRPTLLQEVRSDEQLGWAHERATAVLVSVQAMLILATILSISTFAVALSFSIVMRGYIDVVFLSLYLPVGAFIGMFDLLAFLITRKTANSVIYAVTSKRIFILASVHHLCGGKMETVRAYDLDGIHQTTLVRSGDGCGTLTFSTSSVVDESLVNHHHHYGGVGFAFNNIPNVTAVKDLIEQYKTLRKKHAGNQ